MRFRSTRLILKKPTPVSSRRMDVRWCYGRLANRSRFTSFTHRRWRSLCSPCHHPQPTPMNLHPSSLHRREFLKRTAQASAALAASAGVPFAARAEETARPRGSRISYYCNGEIYVNVPGQPEGKPLTTRHVDFKPSWSKTGDLLVCFRRTKDDPVTVNWKSAIFVINVDGSGYHELS